MTVQEQQMIDELVERIRNTQVQDKDPDAETRLQQGLAGYPDAVYVLAQTVLVQKYGLEQAQQQMQAMQEQIDSLSQQLQAHPQKSGSFLGNLLGMNTQQQQSPPYQPVPQYAQPANLPQGYASQGYPPPAYAQPMGYGAPFGGGGFLRGALQTAAGVAAGEMMFQGMESLFHGFGGERTMGYGGGQPGEVINNNYYGGEEHEHRAEGGDSSFYNPDKDASHENSGDRTEFADSDSKDDTQISTDNDASGDYGYDAGSNDTGTGDSGSGDYGSDGGDNFDGGDNSSF